MSGPSDRIIENALKRMGRAFIHAAFPSRCFVCGALFHLDPTDLGDEAPPTHDTRLSFRREMAPFLCPECLSGFAPVASPCCPMCGVMFKTIGGGDHLCGECLASPKKFGMARAPGLFSGEYKKAIHAFKYRNKSSLSAPLGRMLFWFFQQVWKEIKIDVATPVPLHKKRLRERGFNQAYLLIRDWPRLMEASGFQRPGLRVAADILQRDKQTRSQTGLDRKQRMKNMKNAFSLADGRHIAGKRILLVDDVYTTGATFEECSKVLLKGGAARVDALSLARAMPGFN